MKRIALVLAALLLAGPAVAAPKCAKLDPLLKEAASHGYVARKFTPTELAKFNDAPPQSHYSDIGFILDQNGHILLVFVENGCIAGVKETSTDELRHQSGDGA